MISEEVASDSRGLLTSDEMKMELLNMAVTFSDFCERHSMRCFLVAGSLLGAKRHSGFIPWDDDIDLGISRPDFDKLISLQSEFETETQYKLRGYAYYPLEVAPILKIENENCVLSERDAESGDYLWVDILPVDSFSDSYDEARKEALKAKLLRNFVTIKFSKRNQSAPLKTRLQRFLFSLPGVDMFILRKLHKLSTKHEYGSTKYAGELTWDVYEERHINEFCMFDNLNRQMEFEGHLFYVPNDPHAYLQRMYGDYMTPPEESKRVNHGLSVTRVE